jgi:hypothetical protein
VQALEFVLCASASQATRLFACRPLQGRLEAKNRILFDLKERARKRGMMSMGEIEESSTSDVKRQVNEQALCATLCITNSFTQTLFVTQE